MARSNNDEKRESLVEEAARAAFNRCHPGDSFDDMKRRAPFSKEDRYLLADWLTFAEAELENLGADAR